MKLTLISVLCASILCSTVYAATPEQTTNTSAMTATSNAAQQGENFLKKNKTKPGVVTLADGLQYKIIKAGTGAKPTSTDVVTVDYEGTFIDGKTFDSSAKQGAPASFPVNQVIPGWTEALQLMPVGSTWEVYVPAKLAYGDAGAPPTIGANETLIFKINLIGIQKNS